MPRTDVHSPVNMDPAAYTYVGCFDMVRPIHSDYARSIKNLVMSGTTRFAETGQCDHCGAGNLRYVAVLRHTNGEHIAVGETCLDNRFALESKAQFDALRKQSALDRKAQRIKTAAAEQVGTMSELAQELFTRNYVGNDEKMIATRAHHIVSDIRSKLWMYGSVSERQIACVERAYTEGWAMPKAPIVEEAAVTPVEVVAGRQTVIGTVVSVKLVEGDYGSQFKFLVVCDGFKVWSSIPRAILDALPNEGTVFSNLRGKRVEFVATLKQSRGDKFFGIGSRPTGGVVHGDAAVETGSSMDDPEF